MSNNEFNIKSSTVEKGLEIAKEFIGKLVGPSIEELGLFLSDNVKFLRYKNQIRILLKAKSYVEKRNISTKEIPIKILVPLLEQASLEENEELQDKWAKMITNLVDSKTNFQNQVFPYLLGQISLDEFNGLQEFRKSEKEFQYKKEILLEMEKKGNLNKSDEDIFKLKHDIKNAEQEGFWSSLKSYECSNLIRLGLIKELPPNIIVEKDPEDGDYLYAEYDPEAFGYRITELGEMFIEVCQVKDDVINKQI